MAEHPPPKEFKGFLELQSDAGVVPATWEDHPYLMASGRSRGRRVGRRATRETLSLQSLSPSLGYIMEGERPREPSGDRRNTTVASTSLSQDSAHVGAEDRGDDGIGDVHGEKPAEFPVNAVGHGV